MSTIIQEPDLRQAAPNPAQAPFPAFKRSSLILENGSVYHGFSPAHQREDVFGEAVFTTGMTGYPESLTDPSYTGQILVFTYPLIGNFGVPKEEEWESGKIHAKGVVVSEVCNQWSHHKGRISMLEWLKRQGIPVIFGVDTRAIAKVLRNHGAMLAAIAANEKKITSFIDPNTQHLVSQAAQREPATYGKGNKTILAIDCGMKENIIRCLTSLPATILRVPYNFDISSVSYDGIFISNGPGDPARCVETIPPLKKALNENKPIFGICLGAQLLAIAAGGKTYKLPFGHRGQNVPCQELETKRCYITSQNHGYAIDETSLSKEWKVSFRNLNDASVEGICHKTKPFFAVQFHPEASPGPTDTRWLFETFYKSL